METMTVNFADLNFTEVQVDVETGGLLNAYGRLLTPQEEEAYMSHVKAQVVYEF